MCRECRERFPRHRLHHGDTHVPWCMSEWLTRAGRVRVAGSRHFRRKRNSQFYASDKRSMCRYYYWGRYLVMYGWEVMVKLPNFNGSSRHSNTYVLFVVCNVNMLFALQSIYIYLISQGTSCIKLMNVYFGINLFWAEIKPIDITSYWSDILVIDHSTRFY